MAGMARKRVELLEVLTAAAERADGAGLAASRARIHAAVSLMAVDRPGDALPYLEAARAQAAFRGRYDTWWYSAIACAVLAWLRRRAGDRALGREALSRFIDQPAHAFQPGTPGDQARLWTRSRFAQEVADEHRLAEAGAALPDARTACQELGDRIARLAFFRELAPLTPVHRGKLDLRDVDRRIRHLLRLLRARLEAAR
jgi:hypothetical protein